MQAEVQADDGDGAVAAGLREDLQELRALLQLSSRGAVREGLQALVTKFEAALVAARFAAPSPARLDATEAADAAASAEAPAPAAGWGAGEGEDSLWAVAAPLQPAVVAPASVAAEAAAVAEDVDGVDSQLMAQHPGDGSASAWALKRDWTDEDFQAGEEANKKKLQEFEDALVTRLRAACDRIRGHSAGGAAGAAAPVTEDAASLPPADEASDAGVLDRVLGPVQQSGKPPGAMRAQVLDDPEVLGSALDIVGAYLKNYEVDKAGAVAEAVLPLCNARGGLWKLKALNHLATVRMKQARSEEALEILREVEAYVNQSLQPDDRDAAWEFWETVYRNFAWIHSSLDRTEEAVAYLQRAIDVKERVGLAISWFDLWDLGRMRATSALKRNDAELIKTSQEAVTKALWLHRDAEPKDLTLRAKIWHTVGECSFALGHLAENGSAGAAAASERPNGPAQGKEALAHYRKALKCLKEAHKLFCKTEGPLNPLTGGEAQAVGWTLMKLGDDQEAKEFHLQALEALSRQQSGWGDGGIDSQAPALAQAMQTVDRVMETHRRTGDRQGLARYWPAIEALCAAVCQRLRLSKERVDSAAYEKLVSSCSLIFVATGTEEGMAKSQELMQKYMWDKPSNPQAQLCAGLMRSIHDGQAPGEIPAGTDANVAALLQSVGAPQGGAAGAVDPSMAAALLSSLGQGRGGR